MAGETGQNEIATYLHVRSKASTWLTLWQDLADYVMPRKSAITERKTPDVDGWTDNVYNNDAVHANNVAAAGSYDYLFSGNWFDFAPPPSLKNNNRARRWYRECAEVMRYDIANSNWNTCAHERLLDRGGMGICHLHLEEGKRNFLNFTGANVGNFFCEQDSEGYVDSMWTIHENMTACQIVDEFTDGEDLSALPKEVVLDYRDNKRKYNKHPVLHRVSPRKPSEMNGTLAPEDKPIASVWTHEKSKVILRNSGYDEFTDFVSRYLQWGGEIYGYCPSIEILPVAKQLNFIEMLMDAEAEVKVFPRMLWPQNMAGNIQLNAGGVTFVDPNNVLKNDLPREWLTGGTSGDMEARMVRKKDAIDRAYHVDLFRALADRHKQMTATEVSELVAEKLINFSPTYGRITSELSTPMLKRGFSMELQAGRFPTPPPEVVQLNEATRLGEIEAPQMVYTSKIALALNALQNRKFVEYMQIMEPILQIDPSVAMNINWDQTAKKIADNVGIPVEMQNSDEVVAQLKEQQAQAAQAQMGAEIAKDGAAAAKDISEADTQKLGDLIESSAQ